MSAVFRWIFVIVLADFGHRDADALPSGRQDERPTDSDSRARATGKAREAGAGSPPRIIATRQRGGLGHAREQTRKR